MVCLGQTCMAGKRARQWVRGGRQRKLQIGRRRIGQEWNLGHQRWCPCFFFFGPWSGGCGPRSWGHVAPSCCHHCHGAGKPCKMWLERARVVPVGCLAITLSPVPQASLAFPPAVELPCLCTPSFSQLRHWEPPRGGCWAEAAGLHTGEVAPLL
jgi:hypothetical protein